MAMLLWWVCADCTPAGCAPPADSLVSADWRDPAQVATIRRVARREFVDESQHASRQDQTDFAHPISSRYRTRDDRVSAGDFIEVYENALGPAVCTALIQRFDASGEAVRGATGGGVDLKLKDSWDIPISGRAQWLDAEHALNAAMMSGLMRYLRSYPYTVLAPLALRMPDPAGGSALPLDAERVAALPDDMLQALIRKTLRPGTINLQKYLADQGGYPYWHCELYPKVGDAQAETLHRTLLWTIYLNDGFTQGETEFFHQRRKITPRTGALLIAPTAFTHTHRGNMPKSGNKYIATSWILLQRAEALYAAP
jgi:hypothetical protein